MKHLIHEKSFSGRQNFVVTTEVKVMVCAAIVQLTLGLETWDLEYFNHILIYPDEYKNPTTGRLHKGETNMGGFMCFSWNDFLEGYRNSNDKINLGLHEFGHALRFNGIKGNRCDYFFENYFPRWLACANREYQRLRHNLPSIFRKYGAVNINEFFSVVVETFFENPIEFKTHLPELYKQTSILLNQTFNDKGIPEINCRERMMGENMPVLSTEYKNLIHPVLPMSFPLLMAVWFSIIGIMILFANDGYLSPAPYFCLSIAALCWLRIESKYTRLFIGKNYFQIEKGFFFLRGYKKTTVSIAHIVSLVSQLAIRENKNVGPIDLVYYHEKAFFEEKFLCNIDATLYEKLCDDLRSNGIHVYNWEPRN